MDAAPPVSTPTTASCDPGLIWDAATQVCVLPKQSSLSDDARYEAVRELAYAGRIDEAQDVLRTMSDQTEDRVLTYWGHTHGTRGALELGLDYYDQALSQNPDNVLARSYRGQALVAAGRIKEAEAELAEIIARAGPDVWPATSLRTALATGRGYSY